MTNATFECTTGGRAPSRSASLYELAGLAGLAVRPFAAIAGFYRRRAMLSRLAELDDRMLCDIGLQRFDLQDAATLSSGEDATRFLRGRAIERRQNEARYISGTRHKAS
ncbi:DUF1127 domain-containing protein [Tepidamorphus sp. 3E244]|uniref:DUF1127 domain-containing protein n=1 Tax=Tepidamorphus sp. 3E244 TaxID=3385498 RepID=UPI0038FC37FF